MDAIIGVYNVLEQVQTNAQHAMIHTSLTLTLILAIILAQTTHGQMMLIINAKNVTIIVNFVQALTTKFNALLALKDSTSIKTVVLIDVQ